MSIATHTQDRHTQITDSNWRGISKIAGAAAWLQLAIIISLIIITMVLGPKPDSVEEYYTLFQQNPLAGLLQDDLASLILIALYLPVFFGLYRVLRPVNDAFAGLAVVLTFVAVTTTFAVHSGFSLLHLSDQYAAAANEALRTQLLAAGEAVIASNMWNSSGAYMTGILLQGSGVLISAIMLKSEDFGKLTAYAGILANGFDLAQHIIHPFVPAVSETLLMMAGPFYLLWFFMLGRVLLRLAKGTRLTTSVTHQPAAFTKEKSHVQ